MAYKNFPITIKEKFDFPIDIDIAGLYCIFISARVKSAKQVNGSDDEDLQIEIDGRKFREIPPLDKPQYKNIPPAFNGSELKGLKKTAVFFIPFKQIQIPENVKQYVKEVLDYKKEFEQNGFSRIKIIVSVLFAFAFFIIIANLIPISNYNYAIQKNKIINAMSDSVSSALDGKLDNNDINLAGDTKDNENDLPIAPRVYLNEDNKIVFVNSNNNVARYLDKDRLKISLFNPSDNMSEIYPAIYLMGDVIEQPDNIFYFFATTGSACGSGGCSYVFYKYQALVDKLEALDVRSIVGSPPKMFLSPDVRKTAVLSHMHGGISCVSAYLFVFDLLTGEKKHITKFKDNNFPESYVGSIKWKTDTEIMFTIENFNCNARWKGSWIRDFMYDIKNQKFTLTGEKFAPASKSGG